MQQTYSSEQRLRWKTLSHWSVAAASSLTCLLASEPARASCAGFSSASVLWTYPSNGAIGVPTNAQLLVTGDGHGWPSLDGIQLEPNGLGMFPLGELEPQTTYRVTWGPPELADRAFSFTTGDGPSIEPAPDSASNVELTRSPADLGHCPLVTWPGCFDTGPPTRVRFDAGPAPIAWIIEELSCEGTTRQWVWPTECGSPVLERESRILCVRLQASDGAHLGTPTELLCSTPEVPQTAPRSSSCVGAWPPEDATAIGSKEGVACSSAAPSCSADSAGTPANTAAAPTTHVLSGADSNGGCSTAHAPRRSNAHLPWLTAVLALLVARFRRFQRAAA